MSTVSQIAIAIALFLAFAIGLNLGLHGVIYFHSASPNSASRGLDSPPLGVANVNIPPPIDTTTKKLPELPIKEVEIIPKHVIDTKEVPPTESVVQKLASIELSLASKMDMSPFSSKLLDSYKNTPILLLTCNRPALLRETIASLLKVRGVQKDTILIIQDGNMAEIAQIAKENNLGLVQNVAGLRLRGGAVSDGATRIAEHYKFALTTGFDHFAAAKAVIIVEDDLLFSPDFYEYLTSVAPILDVDKTSFVVSAWNDNGFHHKVEEPYAIRRTEFFPGLGWILTRKLYKGELEAKWPHEHWDHWLRSPETHRNRECIHPQMPRTYHNGVRGTFMDVNTHNRYFRDIHYNQDAAITWLDHDRTSRQLTLSTQSNYERRLEELIQHHCTHIESIAELFSEERKQQILCVWINVAIVADYNPPFETIGKFFGIWHEHHRGNHKGVHEFYFEDNYILLLNIHNTVLNSHYSEWKPDGVRAFGRDYFTNKQALMSMQASKVQHKLYRASQPGQSCDAVCRQQGDGKQCIEALLPYANNCEMLQKHFPCVECSGSMGAEQPAYVREEASAASLPRHCLYNEDTSIMPIKCAASHPDTLRLCVCE